MTRPAERAPISFSEWKPVERDNGIGYSYTLPSTGKLVRVGGDRWMRAKSRISQSALWTGASEYRVHGGLGARRWYRVVTVTQEEAEQFLREAAALTHIMRGPLRRSLTARDRRLNVGAMRTDAARDSREAGTRVRADGAAVCCPTCGARLLLFADSISAALYAALAESAD